MSMPNISSFIPQPETNQQTRALPGKDEWEDEQQLVLILSNLQLKQERTRAGTEYYLPRRW